MNWINIHTETLREESFIGAEPVERATWLCLLGWCCAQENDGVIVGCKSWSSRKWQQLCGVTKEEVEAESELYGFDGDNLVVSFYPSASQAAVRAKREAGSRGGRPRKHKGGKPHGSAGDNHKDKVSLNEKKSKVKESKGKKSKESHSLPFVSDKFKDVWNEWIAYLKEKRKTPTSKTIEMQLDKLGKFSEADAITAINTAIESGWQSLHPRTNQSSINPRTNAKGKSQYA